MIKVAKPVSLYRYSLITLLTNIVVILWGAYVRATGAGAGCGNHWPLCNGVIVPRSPALDTMVEFTHRLSSGVAFLLVLGLWIFVRRSYASEHRLRMFATASMFFMVLEALIGAGLVLFELVAYNHSITRAIVGAFHLLNTFLLLGSITLVMDGLREAVEGRFQLRGIRGVLLITGTVGILLVAISGAIAALGDTLFPSNSFLDGLREEFTAEVHFLIRLRIWHPIIALVSSVLITIGLRLPSPSTIQAPRLQLTLTLLVYFQLFVGLINVLLLAPVWMQILHLLLADLTWVVLILLLNRTQRVRV